MSSPVIEKTISRDPAAALSQNVHLLNWVDKMAALTKPAAIHWVDGSVEEDEMLKAQMVASGTFTKLNEEHFIFFHRDRKSTRLNSSHRCSSYAVFCLKKKITV